MENKVRKEDLPKIQKNQTELVGKNVRQKLMLTSEEAYSFAVLRQLLIDEPMDFERSQNDKTPEDKRLGQENNPIDISQYGLEPVYIKLVAQLVSSKDHTNVPSLSKEQVRECDIVVEKLLLDRRRSVYFARSRANDQTKQIKTVEENLHVDQRFYFDDHWKEAANLDQQKFNNIVLHPFLN